MYHCPWYSSLIRRFPPYRRTGFLSPSVFPCIHPAPLLLESGVRQTTLSPFVPLGSLLMSIKIVRPHPRYDFRAMTVVHQSPACSVIYLPQGSCLHRRDRSPRTPSPRSPAPDAAFLALSLLEDPAPVLSKLKVRPPPPAPHFPETYASPFDLWS